MKFTLKKNSSEKFWYDFIKSDVIIKLDYNLSNLKYLNYIYEKYFTRLYKYVEIEENIRGLFLTYYFDSLPNHNYLSAHFGIVAGLIEKLIGNKIQIEQSISEKKSIVSYVVNYEKGK